jgi:hypothetical protein
MLDMDAAETIGVVNRSCQLLMLVTIFNLGRERISLCRECDATAFLEEFTFFSRA